MSTLKQLLIFILLGIIGYIYFYKPSLLKKIPFLSTISNKKCENFTVPKLENKEEEEVSLSSPTVNVMEIRQLIKMKNSLIKPFTSIMTAPNTNSYSSISELDFKNIQSYLSNLFNLVNVDGINFKIEPKEISPNLYIAYSTNLAFLTPIEISGSVFINQKLFGNINLMIILKGSTNSIYVPKNGIFLGNKKYEIYVEQIKIISVQKNNAPEQKQRGFYATAENIDMMVSDKKQDYNKEPSEIKAERMEENPLTTFTELEDSEEDFNLSEIINEQSNNENTTSAIEINY